MPPIKLGFIYIMQIGIEGPIKIGITKGDPKERAKTLRSSSPYDLRLLGFYLGTASEERQVHKKLSSYRIRSEWYHPTKQVMKFCNDKTKNIDGEKLIRETLRLDVLEMVDGVYPRYSQIGHKEFHDSLKKIGVNQWEFCDWFYKKRIPGNGLVELILKAMESYKTKKSKGGKFKLDQIAAA